MADRNTIAGVLDGLENAASRLEGVFEEVLDLESLMVGPRNEKSMSQPVGGMDSGSMSLLPRLERLRERLDRNTSLVGEAVRLMREDVRPGPKNIGSAAQCEAPTRGRY